jgi:hypothetical protein
MTESGVYIGTNGPLTRRRTLGHATQRAAVALLARLE